VAALLLAISVILNSGAEDLAVDLAALGFAAAGVSHVAVALSYHLRRRGSTSRATVLPEWVAALPRPHREDLEATVAGLDRRTELAERLAELAAARATAAVGGVREMTSATVRAEERIRAGMVGDLHDTVVQSLIVAGYLAEDDAVARPVVVEHIQRAEDELRTVVACTRPPDLVHGSLGAALGTLTRALAVRHDLEVEWGWPEHSSVSAGTAAQTRHSPRLRAGDRAAPAVLATARAWNPEQLPVSASAAVCDPGLPCLDELTAVTLYRFAQESLTNVVKHSGVLTAKAFLRLAPTTVTLTVLDHGSGFVGGTAGCGVPPLEIRSGHPGEHVGLTLMQDRVGHLGGQVTVTAAPGAGTTITVVLPRDVGRHPVDAVQLGPSPAGDG
jgi:signal transduction histidine kinase